MAVHWGVTCPDYRFEALASELADESYKDFPYLRDRWHDWYHRSVTLLRFRFAAYR